ncbi:MAG: hypothetical protein H0T57_10625 [Rubrobacter sp.]|nr:hypothetical protein [Rubrobacter sp.]
MDIKFTLPDEVLEALGPDPEREALEGMLLLLVGEGRLPLERAGEVLGLGSREEAARWYAERILLRLDSETGDVAETEEPTRLEDLSRESLGRSRRFLKIRPAAKGSGLSDISINHDKYLAEDG